MWGVHGLVPSICQKVETYKRLFFFHGCLGIEQIGGSITPGGLVRACATRDFVLQMCVAAVTAMINQGMQTKAFN